VQFFVLVTAYLKKFIHMIYRKIYLLNRLAMLFVFVSCTLLLPTANAHPGLHEQITELDKKLDKTETYSLYVQRAHLNFEGGDYGAALHDLQTAETLGPSEPLFYEYANIYAAQGALAKALTFYNDFIAFNAKLPQAFQGRARVLAQLGQTENAIQDLKTSFALQKHPHPALFIETADLLLTLDKGGVEAALTLLDEGMQRLGGLGQLQEKAIEIQLAQENYADAIARMQALGKERKFNPFWRVDLAEMFIKSGDVSAARQALDVAAEELSGVKQRAAVKALLGRIEIMRGGLNNSY